MLENYKKYERFAYIVFLLFCFALYPYLNRHPNNENVAHIVKIWLDDLLPIIPIFTVPYLLFLPFLFGSLFYFALFSRRFRAPVYAFAFCQLLACLCFIVYQTKIMRPEILSDDVFSQTLRTIYANDAPFNCLPSTHVSLSIVGGWFWIKEVPKIKPAMIIFVFLICCATVLLKQHYLPDVLTGIILAVASIYFGTRLESLFPAHRKVS